MEESSNPGARSPEPEDQLNATRNYTSENSPSSALLDVAQKPSSFSHKKLYHKCSTGSANFEDRTSIVMEKEKASSAGQGAVISTFSDYSSAKESIQDESVVHLSQPESTLTINMVEEQKECSTTQSSVFVLIQPDEEEAENPGSTILNSNTDALVSRAEGSVVVHSSSTMDMTEAEPVCALATVGVNLHSLKNSIDVHKSQPEGTPAMDVVVGQKEAVTYLSAIVPTQPDKDEVEIFGCTSSNSKTDAQVSWGSVDPIVLDSSSAEDITQDEPVAAFAAVDVNLQSLNNIPNILRSQSEVTLPMDGVVEQKQPISTGLPALVLSQPDVKEVKDHGSLVLESSIDAPVSGESYDPVVVDRSSAKDMTQDESVAAFAAVDVNLQSLNNTPNILQSQSEVTLPMDGVVEQKQPITTGLPALVLSQPDVKEVKDHGSLVLESSIDAPVSGESYDPVVVDRSSAKDLAQDESVAAFAAVDVNLQSLNNTPNILRSQSEVTLPMDGVVEQKQPITTGLPALVLSQPDVKEVKDHGSLVLESSIDAPVSGESYDPVVVDRSSAKDMTQDESDVEGTLPMDVQQSQPALVLIQPDKMEVEIPGCTLSNSKTDGQPSRQSDDPVAVGSSSAKDMTQDESVQNPAAIDVKLKSVKNFTDVHQSPSESNLLMDVAVEQKEAITTQFPSSVLIQPDGKVAEIPQTTILNSTVDALIPRDSDNPIVVDNSSAKDTTQGGPVAEQSMNFHRSKSKDTIAVDVFVRHKEEATPEVSDVCQNELQSSLGIHEHSMQSDGNLVAHDSSSEGNVYPDPLGAFCQEEITLITPGHAASCRTNSSLDSETLGSNADSDMLKPGSAKPTTVEQDIGSFTVISCSGNSQEGIDRDGNKHQPVRTDSISVDLPSVYSESRVNNDKVISCSHESKESKTCEDDRSFTFEVGSLADLSESDSGNRWKPFSSIQSCEPQISKEKSEESHLESETECHGIVSKNPEEDNTKQVLGFSTTDEMHISQGEIGKEMPIPKKSAGTGESPCSTHRSVETVKRKQLEEIQHCSYIESNVKASSATSVAAVFHQPFTDLQQVQLRAQIFVYGSLMQGIPPDEACMISAFGEADGGQCLWEGVWRVCAEKYQIQKSPFSTFETPSHSHSVIRVSEQVTRCNSFQSKGPGIPIRSGNMVVSSTTNSTLPLPSPLWSVSTHDGLHSNMPRVTRLDFNQALSPLHSHQSSQIEQYTGSNGPWLFQYPRPGPWVGSSQNSTLNASNQSSIIPVAETIQATPARDSSVPHDVNMQVVSPTAFLSTPEQTSVSVASFAQIESHSKTTPGNNNSTSIVRKSRKRKKGTAVNEELQLNVVVSEPLAGPASVTAASQNVSPIHYQILNRSDTEQRAIFSEETCTKIEQAKLQADDAAAFAASAVRHSQGVWSQLATQKASGLISEVDEKLASAAVAVAAAANVAKAAAAAAKVASNAALQAKLMADEALNSVRTGKLAQISGTGHLDVGKSLEKFTPVSILKGKDKIHGSSSIISAARGAAQRRVEEASAATKRAENLDAIVRAAELAAEAVSQAGTIIAMGEPLPFTLSELVEAGPEGHWKVHHSTTSKLAKASSLHQGENMGLDGFEELNEQPSNKKITQKTTNEGQKITCSEQPAESEEHYEGNGSGNASTSPTDGDEKDNHSASNNKQNSIQKGCLVEVIVDEDDLRGVWFSANVLDVQDGKAFVCCNNLVSDGGNGPLKEWILLEGEGDKAPRIRLAHPTSAAKYEGTRKRRREAMGDHVWAVGDHVDAWIRDGWWEGIVTEKSQGDDTKLTVQFLDGGDSSTVRAWDLRPSLVWKDGRWSEWSRTKENALQPEDDAPQVKRQKLGGLEANVDSEVDGKGINKLSKNLSIEDSRKIEESRPLVLSAKDRTFSVGKNAREESSYDALKVRRKGLQKEGSKVVFGVPKPGKKRKFMEVSKHYIKDKTDKTSEVNDSIKLAKYLMPQAPRAWRNSSKVEYKGKGESDSKPKGLKSVKSQSNQIRSTAERDKSSITISNGVEPGHGLLSNARAALSNEQNRLEKKNRLEVSSYANRNATEKRHVEPSVQPVPVLTYAKKKSTSSVEANLGVKGNPTLAVDQSSISGDSFENTGKTIPDVPEPRRSCRRIQPTSRLLEGLQSSLVISKIPTFSHDKSTKAQHRGASSRGNAHC